MNEIIDAAEAENIATFVRAPSGVGKTTLVSQCLGARRLYPVIEADLGASVAQSDRGELVYQLAHQLNELGEHAQCPTLRDWVLNFNKREFLAKICKEFAKDIQNYTGKKSEAADRIWRIVFKQGEYSNAPTLGRVPDDQFQLAKGYVSACARSTSLCFRILNAHRIDADSLDLCAQVACRDGRTRTLFILECSENGSGDADIAPIRERLARAGIRVETLLVEPMDFTEIADAYGVADTELRDAAQQRFYDKSGNLRDLKDFLKCRLEKLRYERKTRPENNVDRSPPSSDGTAGLIGFASRSAQLAVAVIALNGGRAKLLFLESVLANHPLMSASDIDHVLKQLDRLDIAGRKWDEAEIRHDSISVQLLEKTEFRTVTLQAARSMITWFERQLSTLLTDDWNRIGILGKLVFLYAFTNDPAGVRSVLPDLGDSALRITRPTHAREAVSPVLRLLDGRLPQRDSDALRTMLAPILYDCRLYEDALTLIENIRHSGPDSALLYAATLNRLDRHDEAIAECDRIRQAPAFAETHRVRATIISLYAHRSNVQFDEALSLFRHLMSMDVVDPLDKALALRTAEVVLRIDKSIAYLVQARRLLRGRDNMLEGFTCVDLGMQHGRLGRSRAALAYCTAADKRLKVAPAQRFGSINNRAAIRLQLGIADEDTMADLEHVKEVAPIDFDQLAAENNLVIAQAVRFDHEKALAGCERIRERLASWPNPDKSLLAMLYYNMSWAMRKVGNDQWAHEYGKYHSDYSGKDVGRWRVANFGEAPKRDYVKRLPYKVCWLSPWHFPLRMDVRS